MIRLIQRRLIIPRGDTGTFSVPVLPSYNSGDKAVFSIIDPRTQHSIYNQLMEITDNVISVRFEHGDTVNLPVGKFLWDIKFYQDPRIDEGQIIGGKEVDSYYAAFTMPECEVRQTGDNLLTADDAPGSTLTPQQINAINAALFALDEAVEKTKTNVTHYPTIIDGEWNVWNANLENYTTTGVKASGNGIASIEKTSTEGLVDIYTVNFTDGTTFLYNITNGDRGIGINSISKESSSGLVDTYVIAYTDGTSTSFTITNGAIPSISIGTVQDGPVAAASITGSAANPILNLTLPNAHVPTKVSQLENDAGYLTTETDPTVPAWAKAAQKPSYTAAEVGAPTVAEMNTAIGNAIGNINSFDMAVVQALPEQDISTHTIYLVPKTGESNDVYDEYVYINNAWEMVGNTQIDLSDYALKTEIPEVPVQDVQMNGISMLSDGVANVPLAVNRGIMGVVKINQSLGITEVLGMLTLSEPDLTTIKPGTSAFYAISPKHQHESTFYGLAKAAGDTTQSQSANAVGAYTDEAKIAIQTMLDVPSNADIPTKVSELSNDSGYLTSYTETDPTVPQWAKASTKPSYTATEVGALPSDTHIPSTTAELTNDAGFITANDVPEAPVQDVQVNGVSVLNNGVANVPIASASTLGAVRVNPNTGIDITSGILKIRAADSNLIKNPTPSVLPDSLQATFYPITPYRQHESTFYGLSKVAGVDLANETVTLGTYPEASKTAIKEMLGVQDGLKVVRLI